MNGDVMIEMKGKIFNQLEVIELDEIKSKEKKRKYWFCKCEHKPCYATRDEINEP